MPMYTIERIEQMFFCLPEPARTVVAVAALTGLRHAEIRGLRWCDYDGETLTVARSVWRRHVLEPKTEESAASVPVLPMLQRALDRHRPTDAEPNDPIFAGERKGAPLNLANLARRVIIPVITERGVPWLGWHAFRRGLGTNLSDLGVQPKVTQAILRHSDVRMTLRHYVQELDGATRDALAKFEDALVPFGILEGEKKARSGNESGNAGQSKKREIAKQVNTGPR
jgi:integrase